MSDGGKRDDKGRTALIDVWREQLDFVESKSFRQIIHIAGDGRLRDGNATSREVRDWLSVVPLQRLRACVEECLSESFDESAQALQDVVNEIGTRLGFSVEHGRYRGVKGQVGNDGLWSSEDDFGLTVEIKTTDAYRINLDTIAGYRERLISAGRLQAQRSSILIVVGRQDTGDLEAQIRGSRHAWDIRLISVDSLLRLAEVKEQLSDASTNDKIHQLLRPVEYTRLDAIAELLFAAKQDLEAPPEPLPPAELLTNRPEGTIGSAQVEQARSLAIARVANSHGWSLVRKSRALSATSDGSHRLVCLSSGPYPAPKGATNYWYGFTQVHREYLRDCEDGFLGLACAGVDRLYLIPWSVLCTWLPNLWTTPASPADETAIRHWHISFFDHGERVDLMQSGGGVLCDLLPFLLRK